MSRYQLDLSPLMLQQRSDTGFSDQEVGRAFADSAGVRYRAKYLGSDGNLLNIVLSIRASLQRPKVQLDRGGLQVFVPPGTTNQTLVDIINLTPGSLVVAHAIDPLGIVAEGSTTLAGGVDAQVVLNQQYKFDAATGVDAGVFYHYLNRQQYVTQIEGCFTLSAPTEIQVKIVSLDDGFEPLADEYAIIYLITLSATDPSFILTDTRIQLLPYRAIQVTCAAPGTVRVHY